ncbi:MAG: c-type cytochrome, partial [Verrucomicrobiales bacterium]|nr:c-type cytochrome [Verrucomicrobiales bacterium]
MRHLLAAALLIPVLSSAADFRTFLDTHCLDCHDSDAKKGDLDLSGFTDEAAVMRDRAIWRSVYEKIESHQMPPPKQKSQPTDAQRQELMTWIMDIAARPDPVLDALDPG